MTRSTHIHTHMHIHTHAHTYTHTHTHTHTQSLAHIRTQQAARSMASKCTGATPLHDERHVHNLIANTMEEEDDDAPPASALAHRAQIVFSDSDSEEEVWM